jgi:hypothetical protein
MVTVVERESTDTLNLDLMTHEALESASRPEYHVRPEIRKKDLR